MKLYKCLSKLYRYAFVSEGMKAPTWIKPGDFVSDLEEQGLLFKIDKISKNGLIQLKIGNQTVPGLYYSHCLVKPR